MYVVNAFSLSMLGANLPPEGRTIRVRPISLEEAKTLLQGEFISAVGHPSTAAVISTLLGVEVPPNRVSITVGPGDKILVFQLAVRLAEGQILSAEEVQDLYNRGLASFALVEVVDQ